MTNEESVALVEREWFTHGACQSCGYHGHYVEYGPLLEFAIDINEGMQRLELRCLNPEDKSAAEHVGVRIPFHADA